MQNLDEAIKLIEAGDKEGGRRLVTQILEAEPANGEAWLWMSTLVDSDELRAECLHEVLKHAPRNKVAREALAKLEEAKLGECRAVYKDRGFFMPVVYLLLSVGGFFVFPELIPQEESGLMVASWIFCVLFGLVSVYEIIMAIPRRRVKIYEGGVVYSTIRGTKVVRWEDVVQVWQSYWRGRSGLHIRYTLVIRGEKKPIKLTNERFANLESLGKMIQEKVTRCLLPRYAEILNAGKSANFGSLTLDRSGITRGRKTIPWEKIERVDVHRGMVVIRQQGQWIAWPRVPALQIPNLYVFLTLVDQLVGMSQYRR